MSLANFERPPAPELVDPAVPRDLSVICMKCLECDPKLRFESAEELADELDRWDKRLPIRTRPPGPLGRLRRWCQRYPLVPVLFVSMLAVTAAAMIAGYLRLHSEIRELQAEASGLADDSVEDACVWAAKTAELKLRQSSREVELAARNPDFRGRLRTLQLAENYPKWIDALAKWDLEMGEYPDFEPLNDLQGWLDAWHTADPVEGEARINPDTTWAVWDRKGTLVARTPKTAGIGMGKCYDFRAYFNNRLDDVERDQEVTPQWEPGDPPRLTSVFLTSPNQRWVLAVSAPVWDTDNETFLGVVGTFIRLGSLLEVPTGSGPRPVRYAVLVDPRGDKTRAKIIEHPFHRSSASRESEGGALKDLVVNTLEKHADLPEGTHLTEDPFGRDEFGSLARERFGGTWRTSASPVPVPGRRGELLIALVREDPELNRAPSERFRVRLVLTGLAIISLALAVLAPLWLIFARRFGHR